MAARQVPEPSRTIEKRYVQLESRPADPDGKAEAEAIEPAAERRAYPEEQTRLWKFIDGVFSQLRHDCPIFGILVIGETGTGKSTLINNLLGREVAEIGHTLESETQLVTPHELTVERVPIVVYDTPGLDDTGDDDEKHLEIMKSLLARKKIHLVIYCMKLTETRMRRGLIRTFKEYHKIGVPWEQTVVTITFADVIGDTTARFTQMQQHLKKILIEKVGVTSSIVDVLKICPTAKDPTAALPSGKQWYVPFWLDVVQVLVPAALVQFLHIHKDNIQIGEGTPVSRHPNPVNITLVGEDQKRFQREVDRLPELQATSVALPTGPAFPGPPHQTPVRDPGVATPLPAATPPPPDTVDILEDLNHQLDAKWRLFGTFLRVDYQTMNIIETSKRGQPEDCMLDLLSKWTSSQAGTGTLPRTWQTVVEAVKETGFVAIAENLAHKHGLTLSQ